MIRVQRHAVKSKLIGLLKEAVFITIPPAVVVFVLVLIFQGRDSSESSLITLEYVFKYIVQAVGDSKVLLAFWATLHLAARGLLIGLVLSSFIIVLIGISSKWSRGWISVINSLRAIPLTLLIPFIYIIPVISWLVLPPCLNEHQPDRDPAYIIALGTIFYVVIGAAEGIHSRNETREGIYKQQVGMSNLQYFRYVLRYELTPSVLSMLRITILFALVLAIVLEQLIPYPGIGRMIYEKSLTLHIQNSIGFAQSISLLYWVGFLGTSADALFRYLRRKLVSWEREWIR